MNSLQSLSAEETELKAACIAAVREGMEAFTKVGRALLEIRESRLYRDTHATFEDFCRDQFGMKRQRAYQLIEAASTVAESPECQKFLTSESQARELAKVEPELRAEVLQAAAESGKVTAKSIREAAKPECEKFCTSESQATPAPMDAEARAYHVSLKIKCWADEVKEHVSSLNPSRAELIQAALAFKKLGADFERAAAQLTE